MKATIITIIQNKFYSLILIVVALGIVFAVMVLSSSHGAKRSTVAAVNIKDYQRLSQEIEAFRQKPWNKFAYNALHNQIEASAVADPTPLINETQRKELSDRLTATYFLILKNDAENFIRTADISSASTTEYTTELSRFPSGYQTQSIKKLSTTLRHFRIARGLHSSIEDYIVTHPYEDSTSNNYSATLSLILHEEGLRDNPSLTRLLGQDPYHLSELQRKSVVFLKICRDNSINGYPCNNFLPSKYYQNKCQFKDCK